MPLRWNILVTLLTLAIVARQAHCQAPSTPQTTPAVSAPAQAQPSITTKFEVPAEGTSTGFSVRPVGLVSIDERDEALQNLLVTAWPKEVAAEVLKVPEDKILIVPHVYWHEPQWLDWARKANETRKTNPNYRPKAGPDDKIPLHVKIGSEGVYESVRVELGPWNLAEHEMPGQKDATDEIAERLAMRMVRNSQERTRDFFRQRFVEEINRLQSGIKDLDKETEQLSNERRNSEGTLLSQPQLSERLADLERQVLATNLSLDVLKARRQATSEELDKLTARAQAKAAENETLHTLKRIVELRKARFDRLKQMVAQGLSSREDTDRSEEEMLSAMVDLDRATVAAQKSESQSQLDALAADLSKIAIDRAEAEARLTFLEKACKETAKDLDRRRDADLAASRIQAQLNDKEKRRAVLQQRLTDAEDSLRSSNAYLQLSAGF